MRSFTIPAAALLAALVPTAFAQTYTACNPLNTTGCPDMPALGGNLTFNFNETANADIWTEKNQGTILRTDGGTQFTIKDRGDAPTLQSTFYMLFGRVSIIMKASSGQGIVSSAILQSECLDEIDWEFLGSKPETMTNYFGKGNRTMGDRGKDFNLTAPQDAFHNYTIDWTKDRIQWWVDDKQIREVTFGDALGGKNYPQTPMNIRLGSWAGGDVKNNPKFTVDWAGGETDFSKGPFTMNVQEVYAQDYTSAKTYSWADMDASGDWQKVKVIQGKSETIETAEKPHGIENRYKALSKTAQIAIAASVCGVVVLAALAGLFYFIKQRRAGAREFAAYQAQQDRENADLLQFKEQQMQGGGRFAGGNGYGRI